jgi:hypothetical protein
VPGLERPLQECLGGLIGLVLAIINIRWEICTGKYPEIKSCIPQRSNFLSYHRKGEKFMGDTKNKIKNIKDQVVGRAKEEIGNATNNEELELKARFSRQLQTLKKKQMT